jgi:hypothetical protein
LGCSIEVEPPVDLVSLVKLELVVEGQHEASVQTCNDSVRHAACVLGLSSGTHRASIVRIEVIQLFKGEGDSSENSRCALDRVRTIERAVIWEGIVFCVVIAQGRVHS